mmetsp:Transcript_21164/g.54646  ORF Transcript_21164/g.54646 Transcript_21164/m.54646 type:complete len:246 (+) Transcript_21164:681-1418(+)
MTDSCARPSASDCTLADSFAASCFFFSISYSVFSLADTTMSSSILFCSSSMEAAWRFDSSRTLRSSPSCLICISPIACESWPSAISAIDSRSSSFWYERCFASSSAASIVRARSSAAAARSSAATRTSSSSAALLMVSFSLLDICQTSALPASSAACTAAADAVLSSERTRSSTWTSICSWSSDSRRRSAASAAFSSAKRASSPATSRWCSSSTRCWSELRPEVKLAIFSSARTSVACVVACVAS